MTMDTYNLLDRNNSPGSEGIEPQIITAEVVPEPPPRMEGAAPVRRRRVALPVILFLLTCATTFGTGLSMTPDYEHFALALKSHNQAAAAIALQGMLKAGLLYAGALMTILLCHEGGHFLVARRYGVYASLPYFIPMPISPIGTMGAVIGMEAHTGDRRALFDIGISGPLAGLVPTLIFSALGLYWSEVRPIPAGAVIYGDPLIFRWLGQWIHGPIPPGQDIFVHPVAFAGWVGLLITALNLFPIGQLDGGHILFGLLGRKAHIVATLVLLGATAAVFIAGSVFEQKGVYAWSLMLFLLFLMGPRHPPTANDDVPIGTGRTILGWLTLAFLPFGFTPLPFPMNM